MPDADARPPLLSRPLLTAAIAGPAAILALVLLVPLLSDVATASRIRTDRDHLQRLWETYLAGAHDGRATPRARGYRFWLALFAGDPDVSLKPHSYFHSASAGILSSPNDPVAEPEQIEDALTSVWAGTRDVTTLTPRHCSYAGPRQTIFDRPREAGDRIVGCTGSRDGTGMYAHGVVVVYGDTTTAFLRFANAADDEPDWSSPAFGTVANIDVEVPYGPRRYSVVWPYVHGRWIDVPAPDTPQTAPWQRVLPPAHDNRPEGAPDTHAPANGD